jgi:methylenetetrahydrofolate--tRNA-(uracil-5-)-methyltransferase
MKLIVVGGGLAGSEAAWQAAEAGVDVVLYEMRPVVASGAHRSANLAELVCFNGFGPSAIAPTALSDPRGRLILRAELRQLKSMLMACLDETVLDRPRTYAVDKHRFAQLVNDKIRSHPRIEVRCEEVRSIPLGTTVMATGPMTAQALTQAIAERVGAGNFFAFESSAPLVHRTSIDLDTAFEVTTDGRRMVCCPFDRAQFEAFAHALATAAQVEAHQIEVVYMNDMRIPALPHLDHEGGGAVEQHPIAKLLARVMAPGSLRDPRRPDREPHAVARLMPDAVRPELLKLVGCQTKLKHAEQDRVFAMIPGLSDLRIIKYGHIHMSCFLMSKQLRPTLQLDADPDVFFAGEISGTDSYLAAIGTGWLAGQNAVRRLRGRPLLTLPRTTMFGGICHYLASTDVDDFQPLVPNVFVVEGGPTWDELSHRPTMQDLMARAVTDLATYLDDAA